MQVLSKFQTPVTARVSVEEKRLITLKGMLSQLMENNLATVKGNTISCECKKNTYCLPPVEFETKYLYADLC